MIKQNDKRCILLVQQIGCFLRSCGAIAEFQTGQRLTAEQINNLWDWSKKNGHIDKTNNVKHSAPIATQALRMLGDEKGKFVEIATFNKGKMGYYNFVTEDLKLNKKYYIQKIKTNTRFGTHFRVVDNQGKLMFDPNSPEILPESIFYSIVYIYVGK